MNETHSTSVVRHEDLAHQITKPCYVSLERISPSFHTFIKAERPPKSLPECVNRETELSVASSYSDPISIKKEDHLRINETRGNVKDIHTDGKLSEHEWQKAKKESMNEIHSASVVRHSIIKPCYVSLERISIPAYIKAERPPKSLPKRVNRKTKLSVASSNSDPTSLKKEGHLRINETGGYAENIYSNGELSNTKSTLISGQDTYKGKCSTHEFRVVGIPETLIAPKLEIVSHEHSEENNIEVDFNFGNNNSFIPTPEINGVKVEQEATTKADIQLSELEQWDMQAKRIKLEPTSICDANFVTPTSRTCQHCNMVILGTDNLTEQFHGLCDKIRFRCPFCFVPSVSFETLTEHIATKHPEMEFLVCQLCHYWTIKPSNMEDHLLSHNSVSESCYPNSINPSSSSQNSQKLKMLSENDVSTSSSSSCIDISQTIIKCNVEMELCKIQQPDPCTYTCKQTDETETLELNLDALICKLCALSSPSYKELITHFCQCHNILPFLCPCCSYVWESKEALINHVTNDHPDKQLHQCMSCDYWTTSQVKLEAHELKHINKIYPGHPVDHQQKTCVICDENYLDKAEHMSTIHNISILKCLWCAFISGTRRNLIAHVADVHPIRLLYVCQSCYYWTSTRACLEAHKKIHHSVWAQNWLCVRCDAIFYSSASFREHIHPDISHFTCKLCPRLKFTQLQYVAHLMKAHDMPSELCIFCDFVAASDERDNHMASVHHNKVAFMCEKCTYRATTQYMVNFHRQKHSYTFRHVCRVCSKSFTHKHDFIVHISNHKWTELNPRCNLCWIIVDSKSDLLLHQKYFHAESSSLKIFSSPLPAIYIYKGCKRTST